MLRKRLKLMKKLHKNIEIVMIMLLTVSFLSLLFVSQKKEENFINAETISVYRNQIFTADSQRISISKTISLRNKKRILEQGSRLVWATFEDGIVIETDRKELTIIAVGDDLIHTQVIRSGLQSDGSYDFAHLFEGIQEEIDNADIAMINQETILCDKSLGYTGYPTFGSPYEIGEAIHNAGFDVVLHATNHTMDKGVAGIEDTLQFWKQYEDILVTGINEFNDASERIGYITKNGITIAVLNYTYGLNGFTLPKGKEYMINLLGNEEQMKEDIALAKENSDFVIVCPHWGTEYVYQPTKQQQQLTSFFVNQGVDLVIGTHPHVLEPVEWVQSEDGTHQMLVYYSLGNFVSNQDAMARMLGGMAKIRLVSENGEVKIDEAEIEPLVTHTYYDGKQRFTTYLLKDYSEKLASQHYLNRKQHNAVTLARLQSLTSEILGDWYQIMVSEKEEGTAS